MIIRRRHTANFTTIGNALFKDERLAADEVGIMAYLLSQPHDWEVRRPALMRRWNIGRDTIKRVMTNLIRFGWCIAHKTRLSNGTFHIIYEIRDEPGRDLTDDEIRRALSVVSTEVADGESEGDGASDHLPETGDPPTPEPGVADRRVATRPWPIEDSQSTDHQGRNPTQIGRAFLDVREAWPQDHIVSFVVCEGLHAALTAEAQEAAFQGIKPYLNDWKAKANKLCDLSTYYREKRWERFTSKQPPKPVSVEIKPYTAQWHRWREYRARMREPVTFMESQAAAGKSWFAPSEWPPGIPSLAPDQTNETYMTEDDHAFVERQQL